MSENNRNEILEEQRRARQEFLELKKIQHGEKQAPPKPSEIAIVPKTPKEKWDNFWFQYKWYVVVITAIAVVMAVLITQCATRTKYDYEVVYFTYEVALEEHITMVADYIEKFAEDLNGDGEVNVQVVNCSHSKNSGDTQYKYTMMTKLQAMIAGDENALLFITDDDSYKYLSELSDGKSILEGEPIAFGEDFYAATKSETFGELQKGLQISCRRVDGTVLESKNNIKNIYNNVQKLLLNIKENTK